MIGRKVLSAILGLVLVVAGLYCIASPLATFVSLTWLLGFSMIICAVGDIVTWYDRSRLGFADGWSLAAAILSLAAGVFLVASEALQIVVSEVLVYLAATWLIVLGALRIIKGLELRALHKEAGTQVIGSYWGWVVAMGIVLVLGGVFSFAHPALFAIAVGVIVGMAILMGGVDTIVLALLA